METINYKLINFIVIKKIITLLKTQTTILSQFKISFNFTKRMVKP